MPTIKTEGDAQLGKVTSPNSTDIFYLLRTPYNSTGDDGYVEYQDLVKTHTGDVTGGTALTIANNAVTLAKMADMATASLLGRSTAATGDPEVLSATQARSLLNVADGATANSTDAYLLARGNHSGTQLRSTISDFASGTVAALSDTDVNLYRTAANVWKTDDAFWIVGTSWFGSSQDTNLYRSAANLLKTDDDFWALRGGFGVTPNSSYSLTVKGATSAAAALIQGENNVGVEATRNTYGATTGTHSALRVSALLTSGQVDGFGASIAMGHLAALGGTFNTYALIRAVRNGADNTGKFLINYYSGGSISGGLTLSSAGLDIGTLPYLNTHEQTLWIPATAMNEVTTNGATPGSVERAVNDVMIETMDFDTATQEYAQFAIAMPKSWNEGTFEARFYWTHGSTTTNFGVVWEAQAFHVSNDDGTDGTWGTAQEIGDTGGANGDLYVSSWTPSITGNYTAAQDDLVYWRVGRQVADDGDDMAIAAQLIGVTLRYVATSNSDS